MTAAAVADPTAREFLRNADPVLARVIDAHPEFRPRASIADRSVLIANSGGQESLTSVISALGEGLSAGTPADTARTAIVVTAVPRTGRVDHRTAPVSVPICQ